MKRGPARRNVRVGEVAAVLGGAALLGGSWIAVAASDRVPKLEAQVFDAINGLPGALWPVVWLPMQAGSFVGSLAVSGVTFAVSRNWRLSLASVLGSQSAFWSAKVVKNAVLRGRPNLLLGDVRLREKATGLGYVSGHAGVVFAVAAVLTPSLPARWRPVAVVMSLQVVFARVYAGAHLPLDVVGGAGLGLLLGTLSRWGLGLGGEGLPATARS